MCQDVSLREHLKDSASMLETKVLYNSVAASAPTPAASRVLTVPTFGYLAKTISPLSECSDFVASGKLLALIKMTARLDINSWILLVTELQLTTQEAFDGCPALRRDVSNSIPRSFR